MKLVKPRFEILRIDDDVLKAIEVAGRTCYKSEDAVSEDSFLEFSRRLLSRGHLSVIEHTNATVKFVVDRGVSHELVRHRLCAFSQESTRYCNYGGGVAFVIPPWVSIEPGEYFSEGGHRFSYPDIQWFSSMLNAEAYYKQLLDARWTPQQARSVLPNSLKTEIVVTTNMREWRHIFTLRTSNASHPQMQEIMKPLLLEFAARIPILFDDLATVVLEEKQ